MELADTQVLGACVERRAGSSPAEATHFRSRFIPMVHWKNYLPDFLRRFFVVGLAVLFAVLF